MIIEGEELSTSKVVYYGNTFLFFLLELKQNSLSHAYCSSILASHITHSKAPAGHSDSVAAVGAGLTALLSVLERIIVSQLKMFNASNPANYEK